MSNLPPPLPPNPPGDVIAYARPEFTLPFADKRTGLKVWGILLIVFGAITGCFTVLVPVGAAMLFAFPVNQTPNRGAAVIGMGLATIMYGATTTLLLWTGIATLRLQRWVRPIMLTFSGLAMGLSAAGAISMLISMPAMSRYSSTMTVTTFPPAAGPAAGTAPVVTRQTTAPMPPTAATATWIGLIVGVLMLILVGIAIPAAAFWFFRQVETRLTLEFFDPQGRWTDGVPVPILAVAVTATLGMVTMLLSAVQLILLSDSVLGGIGRAGVVTAVTLLMGFLLFITASLNYHNQSKGWGAAVVTIIVCTTGWLVIIGLTDMNAQMRSLGFDTAQVENLNNLTSVQKLSQTVSTLVIGLMAMAYMFWCRKFYKQPTFTQER